MLSVDVYLSHLREKEANVCAVTLLRQLSSRKALLGLSHESIQTDCQAYLKLKYCRDLTKRTSQYRPKRGRGLKGSTAPCDCLFLSDISDLAPGIDGVMAKDTIFQAIINVEKDLYNTSLPACQSCGDCANHAQCRQEGQTCCTLREHYTNACGALGGFKCGCLPDGQCRFPRGNMTKGDEDCCGSQSHFSLDCPSTRKCGAK